MRRIPARRASLAVATLCASGFMTSVAGAGPRSRGPAARDADHLYWSAEESDPAWSRTVPGRQAPPRRSVAMLAGAPPDGDAAPESYPPGTVLPVTVDPVSGAWMSPTTAVPPGAILEGLPPLRPVSETIPFVRDQAPLEISLDDAVRTALTHNPGLLAVKEDIAAARWRYYQQRAEMHPSLTAGASYTSQTLPPTLGPFTIQSGDLTTRRLVLSQPIYRFGRQRHGIRQRRHETDASRHAYENAADDVNFLTSRAFYDILLQKELAVNARQSLRELQRQYDDTVARYEAGTATQHDVLLARAQLANAKPPLIRAVANLEIANQTFLSILGIDASRQVNLVGDFDDRPSDVTFEESLHLALTLREDLKALEARLAASRSSIEAIRHTYRPDLIATASHDVGRGQRFPVTQDVEINSLTFSLNVPLYDQGLSHSQVREAEALKRRIENEIRQLKIAIRSQVVEAWLRVEEAAQVVETARAAVTAASRALADATLGFEAGIRTNVEVLETQTQLTTARSDLTTARHGYAVARAQLDRVTRRTSR